MRATRIRKQYLVNYRNFSYTVTLIRNEFWRWTMGTISVLPSIGVTSMSHKSNNLTHWGAIKEMNMDIDELLRYSKKEYNTMKTKSEEK